MKLSKKTVLRIFHWLGMAMLAGLIYWAGPRKMLELAGRLNPWWLLLGFLLNIPQIGLKAFRWKKMVNWQGMKFSYPQAFLSYFGSLLIGFITPGRLGEMIKAVTLRNECRVPLARGLSSVILDRVFDMYLLLSLGSLGIVRFAVVGTKLSWPAFIATCVAMFLPLAFLNERVFRLATGIIIGLPALRPRAEWLREQVNHFAEGLAVLTPRHLLTSVGLTVCAYTLFFVQCLCCALALGFTLPFRDLVLMMAASNFISLVPISPPNGLGTREACLTYFLARTVPPQGVTTAVSFGLTIFLVLFVGGGLIGWVCWLYAPLGMRRAASEVTAKTRQ
ncbi:MAG: lysylphosphatidylglycerol synthase transmembrane domain-containing protein [Candidatus Sumerlaeia bacterium]